VTVRDLLGESVSAGVRSAMAGVWNRQWAPFCASAGDEPFQPQEATVVYWMAQLKDRVAPATIKKYLSVVSSICTMNGWPSPVHSPLIERVFRGIKRTSTMQPRPKRMPITTGLLALLKPHFNLTKREDVVVWAAGCVGTYGLLRCGEFTVRHNRVAATLWQRHWVWLSADLAQLTLDGSKTDPFRLGVSIKVAANSSVTCPLAAMRAMERLTPLDGAAPLFMMNDGSPLDRAALVGRFRQAIADAGLDEARFNGHSFRRGGAQSLSLAGVAEHDIQTMGRWASDCYKRYIGITAGQFARYSAAIGALPPAADITIDSH